MGFLRGCIHPMLSKLAWFARKIDTRILFILGEAKASVTQCHSWGSWTQPPSHPCTGTNTQKCPQPAGGSKIKCLFKRPNSSSSTNQPAVQNALVNPEMIWELKKYRHLDAVMALPNENHTEGMGSVSEQFSLSVTERIWLVSACAAESVPHPGVAAAKHQERMGAPGAACAAHKGLELDKSCSARGRRGCSEGALVKNGLFENTRAGVLIENQSVFSWLLYIMREEEDAAGREVFSFADGYQSCERFSPSGAHLPCVKAAEMKEKCLWGHQKNQEIPVRIINKMPVFRLGNLECEVLQASPLSHLLLGHLLLCKGAPSWPWTWVQDSA